MIYRGETTIIGRRIDQKTFFFSYAVERKCAGGL